MTGVILTFPLICHLHCTVTIYTYRWQRTVTGRGGVGWGWVEGWVGAITSWNLHTCLMLRHEKFFSISLYVVNLNVISTYIYIIINMYIYIYVCVCVRVCTNYELMLCHENFS